jgi:hypothetical protein
MTLDDDWRKSSRSQINGQCLQARWHGPSRSIGNANCVQAAWRKSSWSAAHNCTEVRSLGAHVEVRDSKDPGGPVLAFSAGDWNAFLEEIKARRN